MTKLMNSINLQVLVNLLGFPVALQKTTEHSHPTHPQDLNGHTRISSTLPLSMTHVATLSPGNSILANSSP